MDQSSLESQLRQQREMIEKIYISVEKTRKYYLWMMWGTIAFFVLPLIALAFVIPSFLNTYTSELSGITSGSTDTSQTNVLSQLGNLGL